MNSLYHKILDRICENSIFFYNIYFPNSQFLRKEDACAWVNQENDKVYLCTQKYLSFNLEFINFSTVDAFLQHYSFRQILEVPESEFMHHKEFKYHRVIYELFPKNNRTH